jgi:hypothetical protein
MSFKRKYWYPISVDIEIRSRKLRKFVDRTYKKIWPLIFAFFLSVWFFWGYLEYKNGMYLLNNYARIDAPFQGIYTTWRTDGSPGQEPPKE